MRLKQAHRVQPLSVSSASRILILGNSTNQTFLLVKDHSRTTRRSHRGYLAWIRILNGRIDAIRLLTISVSLFDGTKTDRIELVVTGSEENGKLNADANSPHHQARLSGQW